MNRFCGGIYFQVEGVPYYYCRLDGDVSQIEGDAPPTTCGHCNRPIPEDRRKEPRKGRFRTIVQVSVPGTDGFNWRTIKENI